MTEEYTCYTVITQFPKELIEAQKSGATITARLYSKDKIMWYYDLPYNLNIEFLVPYRHCPLRACLHWNSFSYILLIAGGNINETNNFNFHDSIIRIFTIWGDKMKHPINRPENVKEDTETPWYETKYQAPKADDEWTLDPEIPLNYIPVPGEDELYMVVDDSGNITNYRKRVKQADGSWVWQDVNPTSRITMKK